MPCYLQWLASSNDEFFFFTLHNFFQVFFQRINISNDLKFEEEEKCKLWVSKQPQLPIKGEKFPFLKNANTGTLSQVHILWDNYNAPPSPPNILSLWMRGLRNLSSTVTAAITEEGKHLCYFHQKRRER